MIKLVSDTIDKQDIKKLCDWLSQETVPQLTKGPLTEQFQDEWAKKIGTKYSVYVNSGSSSILLTLSALLQSDYLKNKKIIIPALSWHTDLSSPVILGMDPILVDCNLHDLSVDLEHLEELFKRENPSVFILVSVLGLVPDMEAIVELCNKYDVLLLEDVCESAGSKYKNKNLGTFGKASFFSFYYGHHLSTIEGGTINTNDENLYSILLSIRNHGWDRDLSSDQKNVLRKKWQVENFESLYKFYYDGFNCRATDLQAFIGLLQINKLNLFSEKRNKNFIYYKKIIKNNLINFYDDSSRFVSNFAFPVINKNKKLIIEELTKNKIEVRPLIAGSMGNQPFWIKKFGKTSLKNCDIVDKFGFYLPNNQNIKKDEIEFISSIVNNY